MKEIYEDLTPRFLPIKWFGWQLIMTKGSYAYYENKYTTKRGYKKIHLGFSALDIVWLNGDKK